MTRQQALKDNSMFYDGAMCRYNHGTLRYTKSKTCVTCQQLKNRGEDHMAGKLRPQSEQDRIQAMVTKLQAHYQKHGESDVYNSMVHKERERFGFETSKEFFNLLKGFMNRQRVEGSVTDFIRGKIPGARYIGIQARDLLRQRWDGGLSV